jgi:hypothetical protein
VIMDIQTANDLLTNRLPEGGQESLSMISGDLYLKGKGLIIRKPVDNDPAILKEMEEGFSSENVLALVTNNRVDGLLGREPAWSLLRRDGKELSNEETERLAKISSAIVAFWNEREMLDLVREMYWRASALQRDVLRPYIPSGYKDDSGTLKANAARTPEQALEMLFFERVSAEVAGVFRHKATGKPYSVYRRTEVSATDGGVGETLVDFSFVDADGITQFKTFRSEDFDRFLEENFPTLAKYQVRKTGEKQQSEHSIDLNGKIFLHELDLKRPFITDSMRRNQKQISLDKTMKGRNSYTAGFRERHWLGAEKPTKEIDDPNNPGNKIRVPISLKLGAGSATFTQGAEVYDQENKLIGRAKASLVVVDPVDPQTLIRSKEDNAYSILLEASQTHILAADSVAISGISRKDSRSEHEKRLKKDKPRIDALGRYIIEFSLAFIGAATGEDVSAYRCDFNCIVDAGLPTPEEREDNRKAYAAGEISLEELMARNGVEDPQAMLSQIKAEDGFELNELAKIGKIMQDIGGVIPLAMLIELAPIEEEKKQMILKSLRPPVNNGDGLLIEK